MKELGFRQARRPEVAEVIALWQDDALGTVRDTGDLARYEAAFDRIKSEGGDTVVEDDFGGRIVATYQSSFMSGLSLRAAHGAQTESVCLADACHGQGRASVLP